MTPTPEGRITLAQALAVLREDLAAQSPPPASVLAAAQRAARQAAPFRPSGASAAAGAPAPRRLPAWLGAWPWRSGELSRPTGSWGAWAGAATCASVLGVSLLLALRPPHLPPMIETGRPPGGVAGSPARAEAGFAPAMHFVPLVSPDRMRALSQAGEAGGAAAQADTPAWVVTTELPQQRLAAMGLPYDPERAAEPLRAELLVAPSGEVLAVRLLF